MMSHSTPSPFSPSPPVGGEITYTPGGTQHHMPVSGVQQIKRHNSAPSSMLATDNQTRLHHRLPHTGKYGASLMLFKSIVGAGLFAIPYATKLMGVGGAALAMFICGWLCYYCSMVLIRVHDVVVRDTLQRDFTYVSLAKHCFGNKVGATVYGLLVFTSLGSLGAYLVLIGNTLHSIWPSVPALALSAITAGVVLPFCLQNNTSFLRITSVIGNLGVALVIVAVLIEGEKITGGVKEDTSVYEPWFRADNFMQAFGIVGFVWSCSTTVVTVEKSMVKRSEFGPAFRLTTWVVFFLATGFGVVNYLYFGADTCAIIVLNLGKSDLALTAKLAIALDLGFSYPLSMAASREIVEKSLLTDSSSHLEVKRKLIRIVMITITWCLCLFPQFNVILNIIGGWSASVLSFILPPLMLLQVRKTHSDALVLEGGGSSIPAASDGENATPLELLAPSVVGNHHLEHMRHAPSHNANLNGASPLPGGGGGKGGGAMSGTSQKTPSVHGTTTTTSPLASSAAAQLHGGAATTTNAGAATISALDDDGTDYHMRKVVVFATQVHTLATKHHHDGQKDAHDDTHADIRKQTHLLPILHHHSHNGQADSSNKPTSHDDNKKGDDDGAQHPHPHLRRHSIDGTSSSTADVHPPPPPSHSHPASPHHDQTSLVMATALISGSGSIVPGSAIASQVQLSKHIDISHHPLQKSSSSNSSSPSSDLISSPVDISPSSPSTTTTTTPSISSEKSAFKNTSIDQSPVTTPHQNEEDKTAIDEYDDSDDDDDDDDENEQDENFTTSEGGPSSTADDKFLLFSPMVLGGRLREYAFRVFSNAKNASYGGNNSNNSSRSNNNSTHKSASAPADLNKKILSSSNNNNNNPILPAAAAAGVGMATKSVGGSITPHPHMLLHSKTNDHVATTTTMTTTTVQHVDVRIHNHTLHLPHTHSSYDILSQQDKTSEIKDTNNKNEGIVDENKQQTTTMATTTNNNNNNNKKKKKKKTILNKHEQALKKLGVGSSAETVFLVAVALFGVAVLIFTTYSSISSMIGPQSKDSAVCKA